MTQIPAWMAAASLAPCRRMPEQSVAQRLQVIAPRKASRGVSRRDPALVRPRGRTRTPL